MLEKTQEICRIYNIRPSRSKGQNFLVNEEAYDRIVAAADIKPGETILEVGPGLGFLTAKLSKQAGKVIAVELDDKLAEILKTGLDSQDVRNVEVVNKNVLDVVVGSSHLAFGDKRAQDARYQIPATSYKIVANLPYNITSVFLRKFLSEASKKPEMMVLMLQKEVAERIAAEPGRMSILAISVQFYADIEIIEYVPRHDFWPSPEVDSAIIKLKVKSQRSKVDERSFFRLVKIGFSAKRKMLKNNLSAGFQIDQKEAEEKITKAGLDPKIRAEDLAISDWLKILGLLSKN